MDYIQVKHASVSVNGAGACDVLTSLIKQCRVIDKPDVIDLELSKESDGLHLSWNKSKEKPLKYHLDFAKLVCQQRSFPAPKQGAFNQALGRKTKSVVDATGGWAGDAMLMCMQGYRVTIIERLPIMAALIEEAFSRLAKCEWAVNNSVLVPKVVCGDARHLLPQLGGAECVYLDPMFPEKKKKKAATNKNMQLLQWLAGTDNDASEVACIAHQCFQRLAVKRPDYAAPLITKPSVKFSSKLVHYDVYL